MREAGDRYNAYRRFDMRFALNMTFQVSICAKRRRKSPSSTARSRAVPMPGAGEPSTGCFADPPFESLRLKYKNREASASRFLWRTRRDSILHIGSHCLRFALRNFGL